MHGQHRAAACVALGGSGFAPNESCCDTDGIVAGFDDACFECFPDSCTDGTYCEDADCVSGGCGGGGGCVYTSTIPEGMCGDPTTPGCPLTPINDGNPCTIDTCNPNTGVVTHVLAEECIPIPTASSWGVACMALLVVTTATLVFRPRWGIIQP